MGLYSVYDLSETLLRLRIKREEVKKVLYAWGDTSQPNNFGEPEKYDPIKGDTAWEGGFILLLKDKRVICVIGKNDHSGWGCVDSVTIEQSNWDESNYAKFSLNDLKKSFSISEKINPDKDPIDLNRWINKEIELDS